MKKKPVIDILVSEKIIVPYWYCLKYKTLYLKSAIKMKIINDRNEIDMRI
jgi:hypothetical protein|tara:strand:+ start:303 stop:452 length:150 start_codon:yes stop_codon:yes gene_type:complete